MASSKIILSYLLLCTLLLLPHVHAQKRVFGVLFVEQGKVSTKQMKDAVLHQLKFVQREWLRNFGGTFSLDSNPVRVVNGDHGPSWYVNTRSSDVGGNTDFDDITCVYTSGETVPYDDEFPAVCGAHELHEMGHIYGLEHEGPTDDCMQLGFYQNNAPPGGLCKFSRANRRKVKASQREWLTLTSLDNSGSQKDCMFTDRCDGSVKHKVDKGELFRDTCGKFYKVRIRCKLLRVCVYTDACDSSQVVVRPRKTFTDSCGNTYKASSKCVLKSV